MSSRRSWSRHEALRGALADNDRGRISAAAGNVLARLRSTGDVTRLDLVSLSREVLYSSEPAFEPTAAASEDALLAMIGGRRGASGVAIDAERNVTLSVGVLLYADDGTPLAVAIYATDIVQALSELKEDIGAEALIVNRRGRLLAGTDPQIWDAVSGSEWLRDRAAQELRSEDDRVFSLAAFPLEAELGNLVAQVVTVRDVTASFTEQRRVGSITFLGIGGFLLVSLAAVSYYLRRALSPLPTGCRCWMRFRAATPRPPWR